MSMSKAEADACWAKVCESIALDDEFYDELFSMPVIGVPDMGEGAQALETGTDDVPDLTSGGEEE
jgi:hypothetical protein